MITVVVGMLVALLIAGVVVALVAIPARREGREVLSAQGEQLMQSARDRTVEAVEAARDKVGDLAERLPATPRTSAPSQGPDDVPRRDGATIDLRDDHSDAGHHRA